MRMSAVVRIVLSLLLVVPMSVRAMKAGAVDFIEKPFDAALLCESVSNAMDKSAASQQ